MKHRISPQMHAMRGPRFCLLLLTAALLVAAAACAGGAGEDKVNSETASAAGTAVPVVYSPGAAMHDDSGNLLQSHAGDIIKVGDRWYWYGSAPRDANNSLPFAAFGGINVYSSTNLNDFHYEGAAVSPTSSGTLSRSLVAYGPRVMFNAGTGQYVMVLSECCGDGNNGQLETGHLVFLTSSTPVGPFTLSHDEWPGDISVYDMGSFQDDDGTAYVVYSDGNYGISIDRLSGDCLSVAQRVAHFSSGQCEEAPSVAKANGRYFLTDSYCSGWAPNQGHYRSALAMAGPWNSQPDGNLGDSITFNTQAFDILPVQGSAGTTYIWIGDRWDCPQPKCDLSTSTYAWLPLTITGTSMTLSYFNPWYLDVSAGTWWATTGSMMNGGFEDGLAAWATQGSAGQAGRFNGPFGQDGEWFGFIQDYDQGYTSLYQQVSLNAGQAYTFSAKVQGDGTPTRMLVYYPAATSLVASQSVSDLSWQSRALTFTAPATGTYNLGFDSVLSTAGGSYLRVDSVSLTAP